MTFVSRSFVINSSNVSGDGVGDEGAGDGGAGDGGRGVFSFTTFDDGCSSVMIRRISPPTKPASDNGPTLWIGSFPFS